MLTRPSAGPVLRTGHIARLAFGVALLIGGSALISTVAGAAPGSGKAHQVQTAPQPPSNADLSGNGANTNGAYDSTRDGSPSGNGNGNGEAAGKPCAGCVGKADNKNPKGQLVNGSDSNAGYECDRNHGIARTNPAHTGCKTPPPTTTPPPPPTSPPPPGCVVNCAPSSPPPPGCVVNCAPSSPPPPGCVVNCASGQLEVAAVGSATGGSLPTTGVPTLQLLGLATAALVAGAVLAFAGRVRRRATSATSAT